GADHCCRKCQSGIEFQPKNAQLNQQISLLFALVSNRPANISYKKAKGHSSLDHHHHHCWLIRSQILLRRWSLVISSSAALPMITVARSG
ncbi:MAG: hypothetical protein ACQPRI_06260, partial [Solitalea-like symbiont of Tyrophagus putrescentiae]